MAIHPNQIALGDITINSQWNCLASLAVGDPVYVSGNVAYLADCTDIAKMPARGVVLLKLTPTTCVVVHNGKVRVVGWGLTQGEAYFVGPGTGLELRAALPTADGTIIQALGVAEDSDTVMVSATSEFEVVGTTQLDIECDVGPGGVAVRDLVYISGDNQVDKTDATDISKMPAAGFVTSLLGGGKCMVRKMGVLGGFSGILPGVTYWANPLVPGGITPANPNGIARIIQEVAAGLKSDTVLVEIDRDYTANPT